MTVGSHFKGDKTLHQKITIYDQPQYEKKENLPGKRKTVHLRKNYKILKHNNNKK